MNLPIDHDEVEHGVLVQLEATRAPTARCASCLVAALQVDRQRLMVAIRRLLVRPLIEARVH